MSRALNRALLQHEVMPNIDGSPIVESGSNSDGEWTRWADGTQWIGTPDGGLLGSTSGLPTWTFPIAFVNSTYSFSFTPGSSSSTLLASKAAVRSTTTLNVGTTASDGFNSAASFGACFGHWK